MTTFSRLETERNMDSTLTKKSTVKLGNLEPLLEIRRKNKQAENDFSLIPLLSHPSKRMNKIIFYSIKF